MTDARLSNSSVTSSAVVMRGSEINYSWNNFVEENPIPSLFNSDADSQTGNAQTEIQWMGWANPIYKIQGILDEDGDVSNRMTFNLLKDFASNTGSNLYLFDDLFCPSGAKVIIKNFNILRMARYKNTSKYTYSLNLMETL